MTDPGYGQGRPDYGMPGQGQTYPAAGYPGYQQQAPNYQAQQPGYPQGNGYDTGFPAAPSQPSSAASKGFFGSLFDTSFESFVTPTIIKIVYILAMIGVGFGTLVLAIEGFVALHIYGIFVLLIICPLYFFFSLLLTRIYMELIMVIFRLSNDVRVIRDRGGLS
ncbi:MAG TPA: DUF4282 domain-containing protein [Streptosporangiaceae bacterium]|nr:DUF4282 domain-containing protein [Streptosporangiaceae bacterium]